MKKKVLKKRRKQAIKDICNNTYVIGKFRDIFCMHDYDKDEVSQLIKVMIKDFISKGNDDPDKVEFIKAAESRGRYDIIQSLQEDDDYYEEDEDDEGSFEPPTVIKRKSTRKQLGKFFS